MDYENEEIQINDNKTEDCEPNLEISELEDCINNMDGNIVSIWNHIIVPYLKNDSEKQILGKLTENDFDKFYSFMVNSNEIRKSNYDRLMFLKK